MSRKVKEKQFVCTFAKEKESVCVTEMGREIKEEGGVMIPPLWQKSDWLHERQGDTDGPMKEVFTQHSMCQCIR